MIDPSPCLMKSGAPALLNEVDLSLHVTTIAGSKY